MGSACRLSTNVIRLSKSISKHSLRSFLHCAECVFLAPSGSAKYIAFWCKKNRRATNRYQPLSQEGVIASQPDLVVISQDGVKAMGGEDNLWALPGLAQTPAGRNKQVLQVDDMALLGFSVRTPQAILQLRAKAEQLP